MKRKYYQAKKFVRKKNKKVQNATACEFNGVKFKSKLELFCYRKLKENNIPFRYEEETFTLQPSFKPTMSLCEPTVVKDTNGNPTGTAMLLNTKVVRAITWTPDFVGEGWVMDTKGIKTDSYKLKSKMFRIQHDTDYGIFFEPHNQNHVLQCIAIIKEMYN